MDGLSLRMRVSRWAGRFERTGHVYLKVSCDSAWEAKLPPVAVRERGAEVAWPDDSMPAPTIYFTRHSERMALKELVVEVWEKNTLKKDSRLGQARVSLYTLATGPRLLELPVRDGSESRGMLLLTVEVTQVATTAFSLTDVQCSLDAEPAGAGAGLMAEAAFTLPSAAPATSPLPRVGPCAFGAREVAGLPTSTDVHELLGADVEVRVNTVGGTAVGRARLPVFQLYGFKPTDGRKFEVDVVNGAGAVVGTLAGTLAFTDFPSWIQLAGGVLHDDAITAAVFYLPDAPRRPTCSLTLDPMQRTALVTRDRPPAGPTAAPAVNTRAPRLRSSPAAAAAAAAAAAMPVALPPAAAAVMVPLPAAPAPDLHTISHSASASTAAAVAAAYAAAAASLDGGGAAHAPSAPPAPAPVAASASSIAAAAATAANVAVLDSLATRVAAVVKRAHAVASMASDASTLIAALAARENAAEVALNELVMSISAEEEKATSLQAAARERAGHAHAAAAKAEGVAAGGSSLADEASTVARRLAAESEAADDVIAACSAVLEADHRLLPAAEALRRAESEASGFNVGAASRVAASAASAADHAATDIAVARSAGAEPGGLRGTVADAEVKVADAEAKMAAWVPLHTELGAAHSKHAAANSAVARARAEMASLSGTFAARDASVTALIARARELPGEAAAEARRVEEEAKAVAASAAAVSASLAGMSVGGGGGGGGSGGTVTLPGAWRRCWDAGSSSFYFQNEATHKTVWSLPTTPTYNVVWSKPGPLGVELAEFPAAGGGARCELKAFDACTATQGRELMGVGHVVQAVNGMPVVGQSLDAVLAAVRGGGRPLWLQMYDPYAVTPDVAAAAKDPAITVVPAPAPTPDSAGPSPALVPPGGGATGFGGSGPGFGGPMPGFGGPMPGPGFGGPAPGFGGPIPGFGGPIPGFGGPMPGFPPGGGMPMPGFPGGGMPMPGFTAGGMPMPGFPGGPGGYPRGMPMPGFPPR